MDRGNLVWQGLSHLLAEQQPMQEGAELAPGQRHAFQAFVLNQGERNGYDVYELWQPWTVRPPKQVLPEMTEIKAEEKIVFIVEGIGWCHPLRAAVRARGGIRRNPECGSLQFVVVHGTLQVDPINAGGRKVLYLGPQQSSDACVCVSCGEERLLGQMGRVVAKSPVVMVGGQEVLDLTQVEDEKHDDVDLVRKLKRTPSALRYSCLYEVFYSDLDCRWSVYGVVCEPGVTARCRDGAADPFFRHVKIRDRSMLKARSFTVGLFGPEESMPDNRLLVGDIFRTHRMQGQKRMGQTVSGRLKWPEMRDGRQLRQAPMTYTAYSGERTIPPSFDVRYKNSMRPTTDELDKHIISTLREMAADILYPNLREFSKDFRDLPGWQLRFNVVVRVLARKRETATKVNIWVWDSTMYRPNEMEFHVALPDLGPGVELAENIPVLKPGSVTRISLENEFVSLQSLVNVGGWLLICEVTLRPGARPGTKCIKVNEHTRLYGITDNVRNGYLRKRSIPIPPGLPPSFQPPPDGPQPPRRPRFGLPPRPGGIPPGPSHPPSGRGIPPSGGPGSALSGLPTLGPASQAQGTGHSLVPLSQSQPLTDIQIPQLVRYGDSLAPQDFFEAGSLPAPSEPGSSLAVIQAPQISAVAENADTRVPFFSKAPVIMPGTAMALVHEMATETRNIETFERKIQDRSTRRGTELIKYSLDRVTMEFPRTRAGVFRMKYCARCKRHLSSGYDQCVGCQGTTDDRTAIKTFLIDSSGRIPVIWTVVPGVAQRKLEQLVWTLARSAEGFKITIVSEVASDQLQELGPAPLLPASYVLPQQERLVHVVFVEKDWLAEMLNKEN